MKYIGEMVGVECAVVRMLKHGRLGREGERWNQNFRDGEMEKIEKNTMDCQLE